MRDLDHKPVHGAITASGARPSGGAARDGTPAFGPLDDLIARVGETDVTVLLRGERGTGKQLAARAIHARSARGARAFVKVNCAVPESALEAELFGCERGALAGAMHHRPGKLEFANRGTLYLDQVGDLPPALQARLAQAMRDGGASRLGGTDPVRLDVRVIAATDRYLERAVADGQFNEELFFHLNVLCLTIPPLRQRRAEIPEMIRFFIQHYSAHYNKPEVSVSPGTLRLLSRYDWPGNVRQLEAHVKRMVTLGTEHVAPEDLEARPRHPEPAPVPGAAVAGAGPDNPGTIGSLKDIARHAADIAERALIFRTLQHTRWNRREAAEMLGVSYKALLYKIKRAELEGAS